MDERKPDSPKEIGYLLEDQRVVELVENVRNSKKFSSSFAITRGVIFLTQTCNMSCYYCNSTRHPMPRWKSDDVIVLIENLAQNGAKHLQWTGGEASLHPHLPEFIKLSNGLGLSNSISTIGTAPSETYRKLVDAGMNRFYISLDTLDGAEFDRMTGSQGYLERVLSNIFVLVKYRDEGKTIHITLNITLNSRRVLELTRDDWKELKAILNWCVESRVDDFKFLPLEENESDQAGFDPSTLDEFIKTCSALVPSRYRMFHYRLETLKTGDYGVAKMQTCHCFQSLDDRAFDSIGAYPCSIQLREGGARIYEHDQPESEKIQQLKKFLQEERKNDPICNRFCFDLYRSINERTYDLLGDDYPLILEDMVEN